MCQFHIPYYTISDITYQYLKDGRRKMFTYIYLVDLFALIEIISSFLKILQSSKR